MKTGTQCKDKWHNLLNAYIKAKDSSTKTGNGTNTMKSFTHFEQMDMFMGDKHDIAKAYSGTLTRREIVRANASFGELRRDKEKLSSPSSCELRRVKAS